MAHLEVFSLFHKVCGVYVNVANPFVSVLLRTESFSDIGRCLLSAMASSLTPSTDLQICIGKWDNGLPHPGKSVCLNRLKAGYCVLRFSSSKETLLIVKSSKKPL